MTISENIELPKLTADEACFENTGLSKETERLLYLPFIAYKTVLYNNSNELSEYQKDRLKLLFRDEAEQAFNVVHNQVLLMVGNAPTDRLEYFKDFESWKERLVELVKKSLDCITKEQYLKEIEEITNTLPSKEQLAIEGKLTTKGTVTVEGKNQLARILEYLTKKGKEKVFDERIYWNIFSKFIIEAYHLLRRFSIMYSMTMERTDWTIKGLENIGKLPENVKVALEKIRCTSKNSAVTKPLEKAGQGGKKNRGAQKTTEPTEELMHDQVFICYSHKDKKWLDEFQMYLKPYIRNESITAWSDEQIAPGSKWFPKIKMALACTKVAVLLVTPNFIASDFIHEHELTPLLKEAEKGNVHIIWIPVRACSYKETAIKDYQAAIDPQKPLAKIKKADRDEAWVKICGEIKKAVNR